jgi:O-antigen ligase
LRWWHMKYFSFLLYIALITSTGTYIRQRDGSSIEALTIDWLIFAEVLICVIGCVIGTICLLRTKRWGFGGKSFLVYVMIAVLSAFFNPYTTKVIGYCILLAGGFLLTLYMVYSAQSLEELERIESVWLITITLLVLKDTTFGLFFAPKQLDSYGVARLSLGLTHPNGLSFMSAIAFWLSFRDYKIRFPSLLWIPRVLFLFVIYLSRSRIGLICLLIGGFVKIWFVLVRNKSSTSSYLLRLASLFLIISLLLGFSLALFLEIPFFQNIFNTINRGQSIDMILSVTGRTDIWAVATDKIFENNVNFIFGHGYSMSRFVLNEGSGQYDWYFYHAHNLFLEVLLSMGLIGFCTLMALFFHNLKWIFNFDRLQKIYSFNFTIRAGSVVCMMMAFSLTEVSLAFKIGPGALIFIFYLLALDRMDTLLQNGSNDFTDNYFRDF